MTVATKSRAWCEYMYQAHRRTAEVMAKRGDPQALFFAQQAVSYLVEAEMWAKQEIGQ